MAVVCVASTNPVKLAAAASAFQKVFPRQEFSMTGVDVSSGVKAQPDSEQECIEGAMNRAINARECYRDADFWVGIEAGIERQGNEMASFSWTIILSKDGMIGKATTGISFLPPIIARLIDEGKELGEAMDVVFHTQHSKQNNGAVGILTGDAITRQQVHESAVILALIPFKNPNLYR